MFSALFISGCSLFRSESKAPEAVPENAPVNLVDVIARKFSFEPSVIRVKQGEMVVLQITSRDVVHGFRMSAVDVKTDLPPNRPTEIHFYARKKGSIGFHCSNYCGLGHFNMKGRIVIE